ncbi:hypothetical protein GCM10023082_50050 [Streptomyces tremellae]|uniref:Uncharacterized protein n=1 Tax=Streptomyces tremellae TaxID=1124239 RepID=A0ABP7FUC9_9ACTN
MPHRPRRGLAPPDGPDWHRKYHLFHAHLSPGTVAAVLTSDILLAGVKIGSWLVHYLTSRPPQAPASST